MKRRGPHVWKSQYIFGFFIQYRWNSPPQEILSWVMEQFTAYGCNIMAQSHEDIALRYCKITDPKVNSAMWKIWELCRYLWINPPPWNEIKLRKCATTKRQVTAKSNHHTSTSRCQKQNSRFSTHSVHPQFFTPTKQQQEKKKTCSTELKHHNFQTNYC